MFLHANRYYITELALSIKDFYQGIVACFVQKLDIGVLTVSEYYS